jgi:hypothetical protein
MQLGVCFRLVSAIMLAEAEVASLALAALHPLATSSVLCEPCCGVHGDRARGVFGKAPASFGPNRTST